ncbi:hypothetical protein [Aliikangiella sp. G2MR2-5]|uniref:hypothetical protein n=1 Tax=Aliikangiella sp. G2MR2-5 TaxID=2788943 RepID=UPI0018AA1AEA|nr:hypothetical protein [Aliikangiella sp. G2MR2-5]
MKPLSKILSAISLSLVIGAAQASSNNAASTCDDPVASVMRIMNCIQSENALCAASGYASGFTKLHNRIDTETNKPGYFFWLGAFMFIDFELDFDHVAQVSDNQVSMRYVETVTFNDGETFKQHEHALVTVNSSCRMTLWDQYGDNKEQQDVDDKASTLFPF